jgi:hypothetical protein
MRPCQFSRYSGECWQGMRVMMSSVDHKIISLPGGDCQRERHHVRKLRVLSNKWVRVHGIQPGDQPLGLDLNGLRVSAVAPGYRRTACKLASGGPLTD